MPKTKIVGTIGPASRDPETIRALIRAGLNVARLNFSHGTHDDHASAIRLVRAAAAELDAPVAILQDLQGPKIRTGALAGGQPVALADGALVTITTRPVTGSAHLVSTTYAALPAEVKPGDRILVDDGLIALKVIATTATDVQCQVVHGGLLREHKGINLPGVALSTPALTDKDRADLLFGLQQGVDYVALSFVRRARDVQELRAFMRERGYNVPIIAKIEKPEAVEYLDEILAVSDGVMVARGDLGVEMPLEQVPLIQKRIIREANAKGIVVITATQMLESMISNPRPTRAEASDVANAILDGTDAVMLSGEMAVGQFPVETVAVMARIAETVDAEMDCQRRDNPQTMLLRHYHASDAEAISDAAHTIATVADVAAIVAFTQSGLTARLISKDRPCVPIIALTPEEQVYRQLALWWGVTPFVCPYRQSIEAMIDLMEQTLRGRGLVPVGSKVVVMGAIPFGQGLPTNFVQIHQVSP